MRRFLEQNHGRAGSGITWYNRFESSGGIGINIISLAFFEESKPLDNLSALLSSEITLTRLKSQSCWTSSDWIDFHSSLTQ